jgi:hypothetical protein
MTQPNRMTAAETLVAAHQKLRTALAQAEHLSPAPWTITPQRVIRASNGDIVADRSAEAPGDDADLPYIALWHPGLGHALVQWLDSWVGVEFDESAPLHEDLHYAYKVACAILGDQP